MFLYEKAIAHRGLHIENATENSMEAFRKAIEKGYNIETDVHLLKSGEVVVFHDNNLKRVCGKDVEIGKLTLEDIKGDNYLLPNGEHIPLFSEMLDLVDGKTGILLELKIASVFKHDLEREVYKLIRGKESWIAVQSFSPWIMQWFHRNAPEFTIGILCDKVGHAVLQLYHRSIHPTFIAYKVKHAPFARAFCDKFGYNMLNWTVNSEEFYNMALQSGANNIIFENVDIESFGFSVDKLRPVK